MRDSDHDYFSRIFLQKAKDQSKTVFEGLSVDDSMMDSPLRVSFGNSNSKVDKPDSGVELLIKVQVLRLRPILQNVVKVPSSY